MTEPKDQTPQDEAEGMLWAYKFAALEADPDFARRWAAMERGELKGQLIGGTILGAHAAYLARKRQQQSEFFDFVDRNRRSEQ